MASTTNFNWSTPDDTALVKDGAAAIRTLGSSIDTSFVDLKGGTTGQVLAKASNTDLDFSWVAQDDSNAIQNALLTTTGDTIYASGASTPARLGIGSTGQVLTVSGGLPVWATAASGAFTSLATGSLTGSTLTISTISGSYKNLFLVIDSMYGSANDELIYMRLNADTAAKYNFNGIAVAASVVNDASFGQDKFVLAPYGATSTADYKTNATAWIYDYTNTTRQNVQIDGGGRLNAGSGKYRNYLGYYNASAATTSITLFTSAGTFSAGTYTLFGVN
jgi:hypothetical protein